MGSRVLQDTKLKLKYELINDIQHDFLSNNFYVHELINPTTNVPFYVGKGRDDRAWRHISLRNNKRVSTTNPHLYNTIKQLISTVGYITIKIQSTHAAEEDAFVAEEGLIETLGRMVDGSGVLLNINRGGEGYTRNGIPVWQYTMWGEFLTEYPSAKEAARVNGWSNYSVICSCCNRKERSYKGFLWSYKGEEPKVLDKVKPIFQWSFAGELIKVHRSASAAGRELKCDPSTITDCANGTTRQAVGYLWTKSNCPPTLMRRRNTKRVFHENSGMVYNSVTEASVATKHTIGSICACCNGKRVHVGGDQFCYVDDSDQ